MRALNISLILSFILSVFIMNQFVESQKLNQNLRKTIVDPNTKKELTSSIFYNGTIIMGEFNNGLYQGKCILVIASTAVINGEFRNSRPKNGVLTLENLTYKGDFTQDGDFERGVFSYHQSLFVHIQKEENQGFTFRVTNLQNESLRPINGVYSCQDYCFLYQNNQKLISFEFYNKDSFGKPVGVTYSIFSLWKFELNTYQQSQLHTQNKVNLAMGIIAQLRRQKRSQQMELCKLDYKGFYFHISNEKLDRLTLKYQKEVFVYAYEGQNNLNIKDFVLKNLTFSNNFNRKEFHKELIGLDQSSLVNEEIEHDSMIRLILTQFSINILISLFQQEGYQMLENFFNGVKALFWTQGTLLQKINKESYQSIAYEKNDQLIQQKKQIVIEINKNKTELEIAFQNHFFFKQKQNIQQIKETLIGTIQNDNFFGIIQQYRNSKQTIDFYIQSYSREIFINKDSKTYIALEDKENTHQQIWKQIEPTKSILGNFVNGEFKELILEQSFFNSKMVFYDKIDKNKVLIKIKELTLFLLCTSDRKISNQICFIQMQEKGPKLQATFVKLKNAVYQIYLEDLEKILHLDFEKMQVQELIS